VREDEGVLSEGRRQLVTRKGRAEFSFDERDSILPTELKVFGRIHPVTVHGGSFCSASFF
jgi:hypothetical protein